MRVPRWQAMAACASSVLTHGVGLWLLTQCGTGIEEWVLETRVARGQPLVIAATFAASAEDQREVAAEVVVPRTADAPSEAVPVPENPREATPLAIQKLASTTAAARDALAVEVDTRAVEVVPVERREVPEYTEPLDAETESQVPRRTPSDLPLPPVSKVTVLAVQPVEAGATVDELPRKLPTNPAPEYPIEALVAGREGRVLVRVLVSADGWVLNAAVETSSGTPRLDAAALSAVERWRFAPARRGGQAVSYEVLVPVRFSIRRG